MNVGVFEDFERKKVLKCIFTEFKHISNELNY